MANELLKSYLPETMDLVEKQLEEDGIRWGETWRKRDIEGVEERTFARYRDYFDQFINAGIPIPWEKIIGGAHICMVRKNHPELLNEE